ncbi:cyclase family protein [Micromonospora sp. NPDC050686]|uniref:cyclase family protein n=1 Tax=Micromonospora sp. NPDC050686 TaxID=3154631 RepID=UPI0033D3DA39
MVIETILGVPGRSGRGCKDTNGRSHSLVDAATGSAWAAVTAAANGIIARRVLLDIARVRDVPWLEPGQGVFPDDLEEAERCQGVRVRSGDAVLLRTGYGRVRKEAGAASGLTQAGWHAPRPTTCGNGEKNLPAVAA